MHRKATSRSLAQTSHLVVPATQILEFATTQQKYGALSTAGAASATWQKPLVDGAEQPSPSFGVNSAGGPQVTAPETIRIWDELDSRPYPA